MKRGIAWGLGIAATGGLAAAILTTRRPSALLPAGADLTVPGPAPAVLDFGPVQDAGAITGSKTWAGTIGGQNAWVTVYARGHALGAGSSWTQWGNVTSDVYAFALRVQANVLLLLQFDLQETGQVQATLWDALYTGGASIPYTVGAGGVATAAPPTVQMVADAPAWVDAAGHAVYNLMLLSQASPVEMEQGGNMPTRILVGGAGGVPLWQTDALDPTPGGLDGFLRWFSAQRLQTAPAYSPGTPLHPAFPYLGVDPSSGWMGYQKRLPLFLDAHTGLLTVSAFVGWKYAGLYQTHSVSAPPAVDFDSPWIFERFLPGTGHPQLLVQIHNFPPGDIYNSQPPANGGGGVTTRYCWTNETGAQWAYKVHLGGQQAFPLGHTTVGGTALNVPPSPGIAKFALQLPSQGRTFVQLLQPYASSEGIYEYWIAWDPTVDSFAHPTLGVHPDAAFLIAGERGEYQIPAVGSVPVLYVCPLDGFVHLLNAQGGVWYIGGASIVRSLAAAGTPYIDTWVRETLPDATVAQNGVPVEVLSQVGDQIIHWSGSAVRLYAAPGALSVGLHAVPTDGPSWWSMMSATRTYRAGKSPVALSSWLPAGAVPLARITGTLGVPSLQHGAWTATLSAQSVQSTGGGLTVPGAGDYTLTNAGRGWRVS